MPLLLIFFTRGINVVFQPYKHRKLFTGTLMALLFMSYAQRNSHAVYESLWAPSPMKSPPWRSLAWVNANIPPGAKVISDIAPDIELYTNRPALFGIQSNNPDFFLYRLAEEHFDYIVDRQGSFLTPGVGLTENPNAAWDRLRLRFSRFPKQFQLVFEDPVEQTKIYRVMAEPGLVPAYRLYVEASQHYQSGRMNEAYRTLKQCLALDPKLGSANNLLGVVYLRQNDFPNAEKAFRQTIALLPYSTNAMLNLATLYRQTGQIESSEAIVQQALDVSRTDGRGETFLKSVNDLRQLWNRHSSFLFFAAPATDIN